MSTALQRATATGEPLLLPISVETYLARERDSQIKHEYVGGTVFAMAGARNSHNGIAANVLVALGAQLRGKPCRPYGSDTKVRIRLPNQTRFYYPDALVVCQLNAAQDPFQDSPTVIAEVLSLSTRRVDSHEKLDAYLTIPSLSVYLLVEQDEVGVVAYRRTEQGFVREVYGELGNVIRLPEIGAEISLNDIYDGIEFAPEVDDDDEA